MSRWARFMTGELDAIRRGLSGILQTPDVAAMRIEVEQELADRRSEDLPVDPQEFEDT